MLAGARVRRFGEAGARPATIAGRYAGAALVSVRSYAYGEMTLAGDLAHDLAAAGEGGRVPAGVVGLMTPPDDEARRAANHVASRWAVEQLGVGPGERVGLLAFYGPVGGDPDAGPTLHLVLVRGAAEPVGGHRPVLVRYGTLARTVMTDAP